MSAPEHQQLIAFLGERFETVDRRFDTIDRRFDAFDRRFEAFDRRIEAFDRRIDGPRGEILGHFDELYRRLERLEHEYQAMTQTLRRIEALLAHERARREVLERDLATLRANVARLNPRS